MTHPIYTKVGYISGPMSGYPDSNFPAFARAVSALVSLGYTVVSPHALQQMHPDSWQACMRTDIIALMLHCDYIILIEGWASSKGAFLELHNAVLLGMPVYTWDGEQLRLQSKWPVSWDSGRFPPGIDPESP